MSGGPPREGYLPLFNEVGTAMQDDFDPVSDPASNCELPGLVRQAAFTPHPIRVTQNDDRELPGSELTNFGRSVAHYEGDSLVIETTHLRGNYTSPRGQALSDQTTTVETFRRMDDPNVGPALSMDMVILDPGHLTAPWTASWQKHYSPGYEFIEVDCRVTFTYRDPE
jgi:hypothetical protein